ncbi:phage holin family protein [Tenacibaculum soleae]|uniref:phage holin family protein n=1 Tax=Tenacibaculum soleae TaxID=447689 RepID=UPI0023004570|nr:phage holin family protein [Tenacibaculum soleae]
MKTKLSILSFSAAAMITEITGVFVAEVYQFLAIFCVVILDASLAMMKAYKTGSFETNKSFKAVIMLVLFWALLATVLVIEKGFPFASFLSEAVIVPILLFQIISIIKNLSLLGYINNDLAKRILSNIDNHKSA